MKYHKKDFRKLKELPFSFELFHGLENGVRLCCIIWFECVWNTLRADPDLMHSYEIEFRKYAQGVIPCPECVVREIELQASIKKTYIDGSKLTSTIIVKH